MWLWIVSAAELDLQLGGLQTTTFADGERFVKVQESIRGRDAYVIQSTSPPVNEHLMELLLIVSTLRRSSAKSITVVVPYYGAWCLCSCGGWLWLLVSVFRYVVLPCLYLTWLSVVWSWRRMVGYKRSTGKRGKTVRAQRGVKGNVELAVPLSASDVAVMLETMVCVSVCHFMSLSLSLSLCL